MVYENFYDILEEDEYQVISNLKNLILTRRGERIMQPLFGTNLQDSLFEQNTAQLKNNIADSITSAINFWLPYVVVENLTIDTELSLEGIDNE